MNQIEEAYRYCESVTKNHAKSFYFAARFLPRRKQRAVFPVYAFCRHVDDEIDEIVDGNEAEAIRAVERWKAALEKVYFNAENDEDISSISNLKPQNPETKVQRPTTKNQNLVLLAWQDLLKTYKIPLKLPVELMKGVVQDTSVKRYETFEELYVYCYRVASTVGLMSSEILGYSDKDALKYAEAMGIGMQLTNILRDIKEDAAIGRIYLPQEDLRKFDVREEQIFAGELSENFIALMKFQIERARRFYREGEKGIALLERDSRFTVMLASRVYAMILDEIEKRRYNVFAERISTSLFQKMFSMPRIWLKQRFT